MHNYSFFNSYILIIEEKKKEHVCFGQQFIFLNYFISWSNLLPLVKLCCLWPLQGNAGQSRCLRTHSEKVTDWAGVMIHLTQICLIYCIHTQCSIAPEIISASFFIGLRTQPRGMDTALIVYLGLLSFLIKSAYKIQTLLNPVVFIVQF